MMRSRLGCYTFCKRLVDLTAATIAVLVLCPLIFLVAMAVRVALGPPVLLRQVRPGRFGRPFIFYKFRTMTDETDAEGVLLPDEQRLTPFGSWLRRTSLDELPQLINVIRGDMSFVGPRPLLPEYLPLYTEEQSRRHDVSPGITGWAQVNGRNAISWDERLRLDVWYVDHCSFLLDLKVLLMTVARVLLREGISRPGHVTMPRFTGRNDDADA